MSKTDFDLTQIKLRLAVFRGDQRGGSHVN